MEMKKYKITTSNPSFNGERKGIQFKDGKAEAELHEEVKKEFESWGFKVEEATKKAPAKKEPVKKAPAKKK